MSGAALSVETAPETERVVEIMRPEGFARIHAPGTAAVLWRRPPMVFHNWLDSLPPEQLPSLRVTARVDVLADALRAACQTHDTPDNAARAALIADAAGLGQRVAEVIGTRYLRVRLDAVQDDACRKFHLDQVPARLICSYRGRGTQYGRRSADGPPEAIAEAPTGAPLLMRGAQWPGPDSVLVHRSPPVASSGTTRLVLVLDPLLAPPEEG